MKTLLGAWFFSFFLLLSASANPPDISSPSPDGKWLFKARWIEDKGYTWQLENTANHKSYFSDDASPSDDTLPKRLSALWSQDSHYLAINVYLGRIAYAVTVIATNDPTPTDKVEWPRPEEMTMIKEEDRKLWNGDGIANSSASQWMAGDTLLIDVSMRSELVDKSSTTKYRIESTRQTAVQFSGLHGKVVRDDPPDYDKESEP